MEMIETTARHSVDTIADNGMPLGWYALEMDMPTLLEMYDRFDNLGEYRGKRRHGMRRVSLVKAA